MVPQRRRGTGARSEQTLVHQQEQEGLGRAPRLFPAQFLGAFPGRRAQPLAAACVIPPFAP